ncbi:agmatinase family protein [Bacillus sp. FJAT-47783]|uniref:agmatinase family protein n=1 Tax=Bacillus sp. FJAT-47783 TaxID=2922712 RepID=UPI001FAD06F0|nr:agmatinase family protein [Bacillus sp. FJAT-47783]
MKNIYDWVDRPPFIWDEKQEVVEPKVHEWIKPAKEDMAEPDVILLGIPLSRSSISASFASEHPDAFRRAWKSFTTYHLDYDVDLKDLHVIDIGNVKQHVTDISRCHENIKQAISAIRTNYPNAMPISIGGDHSITAMLVKGWKEAHPHEEIGILQFDTHFDLRDLKEFGPANGTPIRNLIESGTVKGSNVHNIGLHGFFNAKSLKEYADEQGVHYVTMKEVRKKGIETVVANALAELAEKVDTIYVTVDMDVLDIAYGPGAPAATPGGMRTDELFDAVYQAGLHEKVKSMDIVCLDPFRDVADATVKSGVYTMLSFLTGVKCR